MRSCSYLPRTVTALHSRRPTFLPHRPSTFHPSHCQQHACLHGARSRVQTHSASDGDKNKPRQSTGPMRLMSEEEEQRLIAFVTYTGIVGSISVTGTKLAGIDLFGSFRWQPEALSAALLLALPVLLLDALTLLPKLHAPSPPPPPATPAGPTSGTAAPDSTGNARALELLRADLLGNDGASGSLRAAATMFQIVATGAGTPSLLSRPAQVLLKLAYVWLRGLTLVSLELTFVWLRDLTSEMLQRGLVVSFLSQWAADRAFEAGADDVAFTVAAPYSLSPLGGSVPVYTSDLAMWVSAAAVTLFIVPAIVGQAKAARAAVASSAALVAIQEPGDEKMDSLIMEWRLIEAVAAQESGMPAQAAYAITLTRGVLRNVLLNAVFVSQGGNLAASLVLALVTDSLLFAYCESGQAQLPSLKGLDVQGPDAPKRQGGKGA